MIAFKDMQHRLRGVFPKAQILSVIFCKNRHRCLILKLMAFLVMMLVVAGVIQKCTYNSSSKKDHKNKHLPIVVLAPVKEANMPVYLDALGSVVSVDSVTIKTQVNGQLQSVAFTEGQIVKIGDLLAEIDSRAYQAQLTQYEGQLARDEALLTNAKLDLKRYQALVKNSVVTKQKLDTQDALVKQYEGTVKSDQGLVDMARLNLTHCHVTSPISGRVGLRLVDPGNLVQTTDANGLLIINAINPINVVFSIPQDNLQPIMKKLDMKHPLKVEAYDRWQNKLLATGELLTVDNQIDSTTGTIKLKSRFSNDDNSLIPNQFINVRMLVDTLEKAAVVPTSAIQYGVKGTFVYMLNSNQTVSIRPITVRAKAGNDTAVMGEGVIAGKSVVIEGGDKLVDGASVLVPESKAARKKEK